MSLLAQLFAVSAVVMGMSHTITKERIFAGLRDRCGGKETWLGYLVSCPYCASHYLAFLLVPLTATYVITVPYHWGIISSVLSWFFSSILVTVVAAFLRIVFYFVDEKQSLTRYEKREAERHVEQSERTTTAAEAADPKLQASARLPWSV